MGAGLTGPSQKNDGLVIWQYGRLGPRSDVVGKLHLERWRINLDHDVRGGRTSTDEVNGAG